MAIVTLEADYSSEELKVAFAIVWQEAGGRDVVARNVGERVRNKRATFVVGEGHH